MVRRWIIDHGLAPQPHNPQVMARNVISEARVRIARYREAPVTALSYAAVLNTAIYRDNSVSFDTLVAQARLEDGISRLDPTGVRSVPPVDYTRAAKS